MANAEIIDEQSACAVERDRFRSALEAIRGPADSGPWIGAYRSAGGGYSGLQEIAQVALGEKPDVA